MNNNEPKRARKKKTAHWHGCKRCQSPYEDACAQTKEDGLCSPCRGLAPWQYLIDNKKPRACCVAGSRTVTKDEMRSYSLAGARTWFICPTCSRTQPFDPKRHPERQIGSKQ